MQDVSHTVTKFLITFSNYFLSKVSLFFVFVHENSFYMVESDTIVKEIKCWQLVLTALAGLVTVESFNCCKAPFTHSRFSLRFTTIHPDFSWSEKSGWTGMNRGEKWKYSVSLRFQ